MKYADIKLCDVSNGEGIRVSLFVSGCNHGCKGCFNQAAWDFAYGDEYTQETEDYIISALSKPYIKGLSLLGGEPLEPRNQEMIAKLVKRVKEELPQKDIWCYSGFTFDRDIMDKMYRFLPHTKDIVENVDYIVDGKWVEDLYDINLRFRGSSNQRIIDVQQSLKDDDVVLYME